MPSNRRRYGDCARKDGNCAACSLLQGDNRDCHGRVVSKLALARMSIGMGQTELAQKSGVHISLIQKIEAGAVDTGNVTARNLLSMARTLGVNPETLI